MYIDRINITKHYDIYPLMIMEMKKMEQQETIVLSLPSNIIEELDEMVRREKTTRDQVLIEALDQYFKSGKIWEQIYQWGEESARELGIKSEDDVDRLIHE
ncbi:MAG: hypothetical protein NTY22_07420 [Proteobacteria bacterium]|nr:hypothetical protein [Pseudomonadota bacterium]